MWYLIGGLFPSPYAATSLREYFAIGFEYYYLKDRSQLKKECPFLYNKLAEIEFPED
jgi:Mlc titration factor MtfA (ptsG expression regulator)